MKWRQNKYNERLILWWRQVYEYSWDESRGTDEMDMRVCSHSTIWIMTVPPCMRAPIEPVPIFISPVNASGARSNGNISPSEWSWESSFKEEPKFRVMLERLLFDAELIKLVGLRGRSMFIPTELHLPFQSSFWGEVFELTQGLKTPLSADMTTLASVSLISSPEGSTSAYGLIHTYPIFFLFFFRKENRSDRKLDKKWVCAVGREHGVFGFDAGGVSDDGDGGFEAVWKYSMSPTKVVNYNIDGLTLSHLIGNKTLLDVLPVRWFLIWIYKHPIYLFRL